MMWSSLEKNLWIRVDSWQLPSTNYQQGHNICGHQCEVNINKCLLTFDTC